MPKLNNERFGEIILFLGAILYSLFPIVINYGVKIIPPIFFLGISTAMATLFFFLITVKRGKLSEIFNLQVLKYTIGIVIFISISPFILTFIGTQYTSANNTAILFHTEIFFTFIIFGLFMGEKISKEKIIAALVLVSGAVLVLYQGSFTLNKGDLLIIAAGALYPIGNTFAKKALRITTSYSLLFLRSLIAFPIILIISFYFENSFSQSFSLLKENIYLILLNGLFLLGLAKICWYEGIKRIDVSKAVLINVTEPVFSLGFAFLLLGEKANLYQISGVALVVTGVFYLTREPKKMAAQNGILP